MLIDDYNRCISRLNTYGLLQIFICKFVYLGTHRQQRLYQKGIRVAKLAGITEKQSGLLLF